MMGARVGRLLRRTGRALSSLQNGLAARYYALILGGVGVLLICALIIQGE